MTAPTLAIIGGSQAYDFLNRKTFGDAKNLRAIKTPYGTVKNIKQFTGESGPFLFLSRHGDDGYSTAAPFVNYRANIWALKEKGIERIISWSGPGIINPGFEVGAYAIPHDLIDMTTRRPHTFFEKGGLGFIRMSDPFCPELRHALIYAAESLDMNAYDKAIYLCTEGPRLETPAEINLYFSYGADLVGMTLCPEAFLARELEICYASICYLVNYAEGIVTREYSSGTLFEGMQSAAERAACQTALERLPDIVLAAATAMSGHSRNCACKESMLRYRKRGDIGEDWRTWIDP